MLNFNWVDYVLLAIFLMSVMAGLMRGFIKEIIALVTWIVAMMVAIMFAAPVASHFTSTPDVHSALTSASASAGFDTATPVSYIAMGISFLVIFFAVLLIGKMINFFISGTAETVGLGFANRFLGGVFGLARGVLVVLLLMFIIQLTPISHEPYWDNSKFVICFEPMLQWINNAISPHFESLKLKATEALEHVSSQLQSGVMKIYSNG